MSDKLSFIFHSSIICKTVKHIDQSDNSCQQILVFNISRLGSLIADWSVENMNPDVTPNAVSLNAGV